VFLWTWVWTLYRAAGSSFISALETKLDILASQGEISGSMDRSRLTLSEIARFLALWSQWVIHEITLEL
jgi:hypothetical protein